ncbi:MAG: helix-turn-helix domain-containing protein [bacterium]
MIDYKKFKALKARAVIMRQRGLSYGEISKKLGVPKSTLSLWLKGLELTDEQKKRLYTKQTFALNSGPQSQKNRRKREIDDIISKAVLEIKMPVSIDSYRFFGVALYWAEGSKTNMFHMTNSDPNLILFWVRWLEKIFNIPAEQLKARLNIYPQQNEKEIIKFWSDLTGIPVVSFGKSYVKPISSNYRKNNLYYGTIRIEVSKSTNLRHRLYGWLKVIMRDISPEVEKIEKKWNKLTNVTRPVNMIKIK